MSPALLRARHCSISVREWYRESSPLAASYIGKPHGSNACPTPRPGYEINRHRG
jgi:hypothetical protein